MPKKRSPSNVTVFPGSPDKQQADMIVSEMSAHELDISVANGTAMAVIATMLAEGANTTHLMRALAALEAHACICHERQSADLCNRMIKALTTGELYT